MPTADPTPAARRPRLSADRALAHPRALVSLRRLGSPWLLAAQRVDLAAETGARAALRHRATKVAGRRWAPAARRALYRRIWADAAAAVGAEIEELDGDLVRLHRGGRTTVVWFHITGLDDPVTLRVALEKALVHRLLRAADVPVPVHFEVPVDDLSAARPLLEGPAPLVVKPAAGTSGGSGVTCEVTTEDDLRRAGLHAARHGNRLLVERQVPGSEYRLLLLDGEVLDVVRRRAPRVTGDGRTTVVGLVDVENGRRAAAGGLGGISVLEVDLDCVLTLARSGRSVRTVLPAGTTVPVRSTANANAPGDNETVDRAAVNPEVVGAAQRAAAAIGLRFAGVDLITPDIGRPLEAAGGAVIEVNGTPGLHYHYLVSDPDAATPVAVTALERLLDREG